MYIDPSAGSLILQLVGAGVIAVAATFSSLRARLRALFKGQHKRRTER
jgi:hypothetical protein